MFFHIYFILQILYSNSCTVTIKERLFNEMMKSRHKDAYSFRRSPIPFCFTLKVTPIIPKQVGFKFKIVM